MQVLITYHPPSVIEFPAGRIDLEPYLEIDLPWEHEPPEAEFVYAGVSSAVTAAIAPGEPPLFLGLFGAVDDLANWRLAPALIGHELWNRATELLGGQYQQVTLEVAPLSFTPLHPAWQELLEAGESGQLRSLQRPRDPREFEIVTSDPDFIQRFDDFLRRLFPGEEPRWPEK